MNHFHQLYVHIPCYNEADSIQAVIHSIPRVVEGIGVRVLVVDDGSTDGTAEFARAAGADAVVSLPVNRGLANAFRVGMNEALKRGADILVTMDGDHQYRGEDIPRLIAPILAGEAEIVIGDRQVRSSPYYSRHKRLLHRIGCRVVRALTGVHSPDPISGFRALTAQAAVRIVIFSSFSYTLEMVMQAAYRGIGVKYIPIETNAPMRASRLFRSSFSFVANSAATMISSYVLYRPLGFFFGISAAFGIIGALPVAYFVWRYMLGDGGGHVQSLVLSGALIVLSVVTFLCGMLSRLIMTNRILHEMTLEKLREMERKKLRELD